jgi:hypothetical protein
MVQILSNSTTNYGAGIRLTKAGIDFIRQPGRGDFSGDAVPNIT